MEIQIVPLSRADYEGYPFTAVYRTDAYYEIAPTDQGFSLCRRGLPAPERKSFSDTLFGGWMEAPAVWGAFRGGELLGIAEGSPERWNNRYRINNLCVFRPEDRGRGTGGRLLAAALAAAVEAGARMAVLETQTCNVNAIAFYRAHGFRVIGFDLYAYTNEDPQRREVRLEMGLPL